ncbi:MAG: hypothetical protein KJN98_08130 [Pontiella sp.]|nr:hypothetical protein [Pontiella sp.]
MNALEYQLEFENCGSYLYARLSGKDSFPASLSYWNKIADQIKQTKHDRLLVHENLIGELTEAEMYDLVVDLQDSGLIDVRIAFFDENPADESLNNLGQLVANHRGGDVCIFKSLSTARRWIEQVHE